MIHGLYDGNSSQLIEQVLNNLELHTVSGYTENNLHDQTNKQTSYTQQTNKLNRQGADLNNSPVDNPAIRRDGEEVHVVVCIILLPAHLHISSQLGLRYRLSW